MLAAFAVPAAELVDAKGMPNIAAFVKGQTSYADAVAALGAPMQVTQAGDGTRAVFMPRPNIAAGAGAVVKRHALSDLLSHVLPLGRSPVGALATASGAGAAGNPALFGGAVGGGRAPACGPRWVCQLDFDSSGHYVAGTCNVLQA
ncbi:MAG TPA: hypothetical protein VF216_09460 [Mizugakiibacter sp.]